MSRGLALLHNGTQEDMYESQVPPGAALPHYRCEPDTHGKLSMITKGSVPQE